MDAEIRVPENFAGLSDEFDGVTKEQKALAAVEAQQQAEPTEADVIDEVSPITINQLDPAAEQALARLSMAKFGLSPEEVAIQTARAVHAQESAREAGEATIFLQQHQSDFEPSQANADLLLGRLNELGLPISARALDYAMHTLKQEGYFAEPSAQSNRQPLRGISGRESARTDYSGDTPQFDEQAYRALPPSARREYAEVVLQAEHRGQRPPSVAEYKRGLRNLLD